MSDKWVVDAEFPKGHLVPMTAAEQAAYDVFLADAATRAAAQAAVDTNVATIHTRMANVLGNLETAYTNWDTLTQVQKDAALKATVRVVAGLVRLELRRLEVAGNGGP